MTVGGLVSIHGLVPVEVAMSQNVHQDRVTRAKRMGWATALGFTLALIWLMAVPGGEAVRAKMTTPCDSSGTHGAYTSALCDNEAMAANAYLISPNGTYRFYLQDDGHTLIYDTTDEENWVVTCDLGWVEGASHFVFSATPGDSYGTANAAFYVNSGSQLLFGTAFGNFTGDFYMTLTNSGDLEWRDQGGSNLFLNLCDLNRPKAQPRP